MPVYASDFPHSILGVRGRLIARTTKPGQAPGLWFKQQWVSEARQLPSWGTGACLQVSISYDDDCGNGHNTCSITGDIFKRYTNANGSSTREDIGGGQVKAEIIEAFPELASLLQWHLVSSDGPLHYVANTTYHASDRDHRGLLAGEQRQLCGPDGVEWWHLEAYCADDAAISSYHKQNGGAGPVVPLHALQKDWKGEAPPAAPVLRWARTMITGEGKARDLPAARRAACWPDATEADLLWPKTELAALLMARLPALLERFQSAMVDACGFWWSPEGHTIERA